jgi:hypothetical protein
MADSEHDSSIDDIRPTALPNLGFSQLFLWIVQYGVSSEWMTVTHDVPQGSIRGPLLLTYIYINDLPLITGINSKVVLLQTIPALL